MVESSYPAVEQALPTEISSMEEGVAVPSTPAQHRVLTMTDPAEIPVADSGESGRRVSRTSKCVRQDAPHKMRKLPDSPGVKRDHSSVHGLAEPSLPINAIRSTLGKRVAKWVSKRLEEPATVVQLFAVGCVIYIGIRTFPPKPTGLLDTETLTICPRETVCAETWYAFVLLAISRAGAYFIYPWMMLLFLSKTNNLRTALQQSFLSMYIPFHDLHELHVLAGYIVAIGSTIHGICHMIRFIAHDRAHLLWHSDSGRTGIIALCLTPFIVLPMIKGSLKKRMTWEFRKALHYLSIVWGIILCFHAPVMSIAWLMGVPVGLYITDYLYGSFFRTYKINDSTFARLERGVELTFKHPEGFKTDIGGYVMICVPWLNKQWHPFSVYRHPTSPHHSSLFIYDLGNWTNALHTSVEYSTRRPVWICGPFASPYTTAIDYDHLVLVATGIGITPALAVLASHKHSRRVNMIWLCRDASLVEYFLNHASFPTDAWTIIYYTGKKQLEMPEDKLPRSVLIFNGRPDLNGVICELVSGIETGAGLPEDFVAESAAFELEMRQYAEVRRERSHSRRNAAVDRFGHMLLHAWSIEDLRERFLQMAGDDKISIQAEEFEQFLVTAMPEEFYPEEVEEIIRYFTSSSPLVFDGIDQQDPASTEASSLIDAEEPAVPAQTILVEELRTFAEAQLRNEMIPPQVPLTSCKPAEKKTATPAVRTADGKDAKQSKKSSSRASAPSFPKKEKTKFLADIGRGDVEAGKARLETWQILYCGGSQPIVDTLEQLSEGVGIAFKKEKFDW